MSKRLAGKVALVTGATRGIGYAAARALAVEGAHVIALGRTIGGLEELDDEIKAQGGTCTLMPFNLFLLDQIEALGPTIYEKFGRLDILAGNAAMLGNLSPVAHTDLKTWDKVMMLNVNANMRLIRTCDPLLRAAEAGRAMFVTSGASKSCKAFWSMYASSKAALEAMVTCYAAELEQTRVRVNLLDPGRIRTGMRAEAYPGEDPETLPAPETIAPAFVQLALPECPHHGQRLNAADLLG